MSPKTVKILLLVLLAASRAHAQGTLYVSFGDSIRSIDAQGQSQVFATPSMYPYGLAFDRNGTLYACDSLDQIYRFDSSGVGTLFANTGPFSGPLSMAFGPDGCLYVANYMTSAIFRYDPEGRLSIFARSPALSSPQSLAFDSSGNLYLASRNNTIYRFDASGNPTLFATAGLNWPFDIAFDRNGNLFVANATDASIYRFDPQGQGTFFARAASSPHELAIDDAGNLYVTFYSHLAQIQRFDPLGNATTFFDTSPYGAALGIAFIPEPSGLGLLAVLCGFVAARKRGRA